MYTADRIERGRSREHTPALAALQSSIHTDARNTNDEQTHFGLPPSCAFDDDFVQIAARLKDDLFGLSPTFYQCTNYWCSQSFDSADGCLQHTRDCRPLQRPQRRTSALRSSSSASPVRSMIDDRVRMADEERVRSRNVSPATPPSPFRSGSPFEAEYVASLRGVSPSGFGSPSSASLSELPSYPERQHYFAPPPLHKWAGSSASNPGGGFKCTYPSCDAAPFATQYLLESHKRVHSSPRPFFCPVQGCPRSEGGKGFKRKNEMIRHKLVHDSPGHICPFCTDREHKYPRPDNLMRHVRVHHADKDVNDSRLQQVLKARLRSICSRCNRRKVHCTADRLCSQCAVRGRTDIHGQYDGGHCLPPHRIRCTMLDEKRSQCHTDCLGVVGFICHLQCGHTHTATLDHDCPVCRKVLRTVQDLIAHMTAHRGTGPIGRDADISRLSLDDSSPKSPIKESIEVADSAIKKSDTDGGLQQRSRNTQSARSPTRTPSFSPPYMRPRSPTPAEVAADTKAVESLSLQSRPPSPHTPCALASEPELAGPSIKPTNSASALVVSESSKGSSTDLLSANSIQPDIDGRVVTRAKGKRGASPLEPKKYVCDVCGKTFNRRTLRENHLRTHTEERPFTCSVEGCKETFKLGNEQRRHEQTKHKEKKFSCGGVLNSGRPWGCGKRFARSDGLLEHQTKTKKGGRCLEERDH